MVAQFYEYIKNTELYILEGKMACVHYKVIKVNYVSVQQQ